MGKDRVVEIYVEPVKVRGGWSPNDTFLAGTQEFIVETAECLVKLGHTVTVLYDGESVEKNGVYYLPHEFLTGRDVVIGINTRPPIMGDSKTIYWTNQYHDRFEDCKWADRIVLISDYQKSIFGKSDERVVVVPHACWPDKLKPIKKIKGQCLFSSSPDRGLGFIVSIFADVEKETGAKLIHTYEEDISSEQMDKLYQESEFWLHPGDGVELFCISGYKAQTAGCIPVVVPNMALAETIKNGVKTTRKEFKNDLIKAIKNPPEVKPFKAKTWMDVTKDLEKLF